MTSPAGPPPADPAWSLMEKIQSQVRGLDRATLRGALAPAITALRSPRGGEEASRAVGAALGLCRSMYGEARSTEALVLARAALDAALAGGEAWLQRRAAIACGVLAADSADLVAAIGHYSLALRLAAEAGDPVEASGIWSNIGAAMGIAGHYELAARCYRRCIALVEDRPEPLVCRYAGYGNLADSLYQIGQAAEGLPFALRALREQTPGFREQDLLGAVVLERSVVRLLIAVGRAEEAEPHVSQCSALAERSGSPRANVTAATARGLFELALGQTDLALTRLEGALAAAREVPAALRDTLACVIRAEEAAGNVERALIRLNELSDHIYRIAVERAHAHIEVAAVARTEVPNPLEQEEEQARARLVAQLEPPAPPPEWATLDRLAVSAVLRMDDTGWHGKRVGALVKALALSLGVAPLSALELGLAAELHDIGLMSVPEGILKKRGPLNDAERAIVRRHVDAGAEILCDDRHPRIFLAREIARYHHARWDGQGYPERVGGKRVPLSARLCSVADAYDAMVCGLGRREPIGMDAALEELKREAGAQFDPELVAAFERLIRTETEDLGMDLASNSGLDGFQALVSALQEERGFV